jgi:CBS domain-containing protein
MNVSSLMTRDPVCCSSDQSVHEVARLMMDNDCGEIPVVRNHGDRTLVGVVTDRDIVCRIVASGMNPFDTRVERAMSSPAICASPDMSLEQCLELMASNQIRRVPVVDGDGICGIVSQADVAVEVSGKATGELVREISRPN